MPLPARHCRSEQAIMKMSRTPDLSLRGGAADVAISQYPAGSQEGYRRNRDCLPEIATAPSGPRNDKLGAITVLSSTCASCQCAAGPGCPLPYNGGCDQRDCLPEIAPQGHFLALRAQGATAPSGPRNDKSGAITVLSSSCASCQRAAGPGCPLLYNGVCDQRECLPEIATSAVGLLAMTSRGLSPDFEFLTPR